jgi:flagellar biogenesis protein FliO
MPDNKPPEEPDVTSEWRATHGQQSAATRLRLFAAIAWIIAIGGEIAGIVLLYRHKFDHGNLPLLIGILVGIAIFAVAGSLMWKAANTHDPARESDKARFFFQNQLGAIITLIAFLPLIVLIFMDKDMDPKNKKIAGGVGVVLAAVATLIGVSWNPPSVEQYTKDMNKCAAEIKASQPTTDCSPEVADQAKAIAQDSATVADATKSAANPNGQDVVYWIAPENGAKKSSSPHVFHICQGVSPLNGKTVNHGSVTQAYAENATRITKQIPMEQKQCGFAGSK